MKVLLHWRFNYIHVRLTDCRQGILQCLLYIITLSMDACCLIAFGCSVIQFSINVFCSRHDELRIVEKSNFVYALETKKNSEFSCYSTNRMFYYFLKIVLATNYELFYSRFYFTFLLSLRVVLIFDKALKMFCFAMTATIKDFTVRNMTPYCLTTF